MDSKFVQMLATGDEAGLERAYYDNECPHFFSVDWRECDDDIVRYCAECLALDDLTIEWCDEELVATFAGEGMVIPLKMDPGDRHVTVCALNDLLAPKYEIRYLVLSGGSDTAGYCALSTADWQALERAHAEAVTENFIDPRKLPNLFTEFCEENLPVPARARFLRMMNRSRN